MVNGLVAISLVGCKPLERRLKLYIPPASQKSGLSVNTPGNPIQIPCSVGRHCDASYAVEVGERCFLPGA